MPPIQKSSTYGNVTPERIGEAKTVEAKLISAGVDKMPPEQRERALTMMKLMFLEYADYFERTDSDDPDNA